MIISIRSTPFLFSKILGRRILEETAEILGWEGVEEKKIGNSSKLFSFFSSRRRAQDGESTTKSNFTKTPKESVFFQAWLTYYEVLVTEMWSYFSCSLPKLSL